MLLKTIRHNNGHVDGKTHENVFPEANCWENFRLLSETFLRANSHSLTFFFVEFTQ